MKTAIVCEGGGMRGVFTAGVLQSFLDAGFIADELVGVSAGASNGASYVSRQPGRGYRTNVDYTNDRRYLSFSNWIKTGSLFGMDFIFGEIPERLDPFDFDAFYASSTRYYAGACDVETGKTVFFGQPEMDRFLTALRASCSLPVLGSMVEMDGKKYLDGGVSSPIPFEKALSDNCDFLVVVLTRERGYVKKWQNLRLLYRLWYSQYPLLRKAIDERHKIYNQSLLRLKKLEENGTALVIAPPQPLTADRFGRNKASLEESYTIGLQMGEKALPRIFNTLGASDK